MVRNQALKSLYPIGGREVIWKTALRIAANDDNDLALRETGLLFLSRTSDREAKSFLGDFRNDREERLRAAAEKALDIEKIRELWIHFRLRYDPVLHRAFEVLELE